MKNDLVAILKRIDRRLKDTGKSANLASKEAGKPDAIRNLRRAAKSGAGRQGISTSTVEALAVALEARPAWLLTGEEPVSPGERHVVPVGQEFPPDPDPDAAPASNRPDRNRTVHVPDLNIFGALGSGGLLSVLADAKSGQIIDPEQLRGHWTFPEYMVRSFGSLRTVYAWEVRGDSMEPTLPGGSVVFVDVAQNTLPPDDIYALDYGDGLVVKRVKLVPRSTRLKVISDNERYDEDELERSEIAVYGRVVGWFQWRK